MQHMRRHKTQRTHKVQTKCNKYKQHTDTKHTEIQITQYKYKIQSQWIHAVQNTQHTEIQNTKHTCTIRKQ